MELRTVIWLDFGDFGQGPTEKRRKFPTPEAARKRTAWIPKRQSAAIASFALTTLALPASSDLTVTPGE